MVEESTVLARAVLSSPDMGAAPQIRRGDDRIDKLYRRLESSLICLSPVGQVREVLSFMHCLRDLERFGEYCELAALKRCTALANDVRDDVLTVDDAGRCWPSPSTASAKKISVPGPGSRPLMTWWTGTTNS